jgi:hypothetical protein
LIIQSKGRIERIHGTHQDRLVKKLRRQQIASHEAANVYLRRDYLPEHNRRFARVAARPEDYHRRAPRAAELDGIFRLESERVVSQDGVVRYANRYFQLSHQAPARSKVLVCEGRHGAMAIEYRGRALRWEEISAPAKPRVESERRSPLPVVRPKWVPPANHPWREAVRREVQQKALRESVRQPSLAGLRFALNAPPYGLRRASLPSQPTDRRDQKIRTKGDISNLVRKGTFLNWFDTSRAPR